MMELQVQHDPVGQKFFVIVEKKEAVLAYTQVNHVLDLHHTLVPPELRGRGIAEQLAHAAFDYAKAHGYKVLPSCSYIRETFLKQHPAYGALVVQDIMEGL